MSVRNGIALLLALSTITLFVGCGSSGSGSPPAQPPPGGSFSNSNLSGTYVFSVSGTDVNGFPFAIVGTLTANGQSVGGITGGTIDIVDPDTDLSVLATNSSISNGSYMVDVDGRGTATLSTTTAFGNITFEFVLQNSSHGLITQFDGHASGSGTIDAQTAATPSGSYAFSLSGTDGTNLYPMATVGAFTLATNTGLVPVPLSGAEDFNDANLAYPNQSLSGGFELGPSSTPSTTLITASFGTLTFDVYAIDSTHLKLIETDGIEFLSGDAYSQTTATVPTGSLAFTLAGFFPFSTGSSFSPAAAGGFMVTDGAGNITNASTEDVNDSGTASSLPVTFTGSYSNTDSIIPGRFYLNNFSGFFGGTQYAAYPSSGGMLLLEIDDSGILAGAAYGPQTSTSFTPPQGFGLNLSGFNLTDGVEVDDIAEFATSATTCISGATFCGLIDENYDPGGAPIIPAQVFDGTFGTIGSVPGRYGLGTTALNNTLNGQAGIADVFTFYTVDGTTFPFIEMDDGQVSAGVFVLQNASAAAPAAAKSNMFVVRPLVRAHAALRKKK